jgi:hypothetical protein
MNRDQFEQRLNEVLDRRESPEADAQLRAAAEASTELRQLLSAYASAIEGARQQPIPACREDFDQQIMSYVKRSPATGLEPAVVTPVDRSQAAQRRWVAGVLALAAAVMLVAAPAWWLAPRGAQDPSDHSTELARTRAGAVPEVPESAPDTALTAGPTAGQGDVAAQEGEVDAPARSESDRSRPAAADFEQLTRDATEQFSALAALLPGIRVEELAADDRASDAQAGTTSGENVLGQMGEGLEPLASSTTGALGFLFKMLPTDDADRHAL